MAEPFTRHTGLAAPLMIDNVDTDQIIPSREMRTVGRAGLREGLFAGWRYASPDTREPNPDFVLNQPAYQGATVLISGVNFGCGSSREHAVWALAEFGVRAILAPSFGEIFYANCTRNGVLPAPVPADTLAALAAHVAADPAQNVVTVDLAEQTIQAVGLAGIVARFDIAPFPKRMLYEGLDPIGLTLTRGEEIAAFHAADRLARPWVYLD